MRTLTFALTLALAGAASVQVAYRDFTTAHPDFGHDRGGGVATGCVETTLDANHKPQLKAGCVNKFAYTSMANFDKWYSANISTIEGTLTLSQVGTTDQFQFDSDSFFPLTGIGCKDSGRNGQNYLFTTEMTMTFQYTGGTDLYTQGEGGGKSNLPDADDFLPRFPPTTSSPNPPRSKFPPPPCTPVFPAPPPFPS